MKPRTLTDDFPWPVPRAAKIAMGFARHVTMHTPGLNGMDGESDAAIYIGRSVELREGESLREGEGGEGIGKCGANSLFSGAPLE